MRVVQSNQELLEVETRSPDSASAECRLHGRNRRENPQDCWTPAGSVSLHPSGVIVARAF